MSQYNIILMIKELLDQSNFMISLVYCEMKVSNSYVRTTQQGSTEINPNDKSKSVQTPATDTPLWKFCNQVDGSWTCKPHKSSFFHSIILKEFSSNCFVYKLIMMLTVSNQHWILVEKLHSSKNDILFT